MIVCCCQDSPRCKVKVWRAVKKTNEFSTERWNEDRKKNASSNTEHSMTKAMGSMCFSLYNTILQSGLRSNVHFLCRRNFPFIWVQFHFIRLLVKWWSEVNIIYVSTSAIIGHVVFLRVWCCCMFGQPSPPQAMFHHVPPPIRVPASIFFALLVSGVFASMASPSPKDARHHNLKVWAWIF